MNAIFCQLRIFKASPGAHRIISYDYKKIKDTCYTYMNKYVDTCYIVYQSYALRSCFPLYLFEYNL